MVVASNREAIMMVESGSVEVSEETILEGIRLAHQSNVQTIGLIDQMVEARGDEKVTVTVDYSAAEEREQKVDALVNGRIRRGAGGATHTRVNATPAWTPSNPKSPPSWPTTCPPKRWPKPSRTWSRDRFAAAS